MLLQVRSAETSKVVHFKERSGKLLLAAFVSFPLISRVPLEDISIPESVKALFTLKFPSIVRDAPVSISREATV